jgi:hypothetical protein
VATATNLSGNYTFYVAGWDTVGDFYAAAGVVSLDGNGNVTAGEEDLNNTGFTTAPSIDDQLTGTYTVNSDGQGTMTLNATASGSPDTQVGVDGTQTMSFVIVNNDHILIDEFDSALTSSGSMDFQTASAIATGFSGNYALTEGGFLGGDPTVLGGVATASGTTLTGTDTGDEDSAGSVIQGGTISGAITAPDAMGRGTFTIGGTTYASYIVGAEAVYYAEIDLGGVLVGQAYGQGSGALSAASLTGGFVMNEPQPYGESMTGLVALAGQFTSDGLGTSSTSISGVTDYNEAGTVPPSPPDTITASYAIASSGYGSMTAAVSNDADFVLYGIYVTDPALNINDPNNTSGGGGALIAELDPNDLGLGFFAPQSATALSEINNGNQFNGFDSNGDQYNSTGQLAFSPTAFAGTENLNNLNLGGTQTESAATPITGAITADTTNVGRYTIVVTINSTASNLVSYVANGSLAVSVDVDSTPLTEIGSGITEGQQ